MINFGIWVQYVPGHTSASNHKCSRMLAEHPDLPAADDVISAREELACRQAQSAGLLPDRERKTEKKEKETLRENILTGLSARTPHMMKIRSRSCRA